MAIQFDSSKISIFRDTKFQEADSIANIGDGGGLKVNGSYYGKLGAIFRSAATKAGNNAVRTELLKSLGQAFGIEGMSMKGGKVTFSKDFMDKLEMILGHDVIKPEDFKIGKDGSVTSGRPLTQRRISAIIKQATIVGKGDFSIEAYRVKLDAIKEELGLTGLSEKQLKKLFSDKPELKLFDDADKCLDFLKKDLVMGHKIVDRQTGEEKMVYGEDNQDTDPSVIRNHPDYVFLKSIGEAKGCPKFQFLNYKTGKFEELKSTYNWNNDHLMKRLGGEFIHLERADFDADKSEDIEPLKKYIRDNVQLFVKKMVDVYQEAKETGKMEDFMRHLKNPGACLEDKCLHLVEFQNGIAPKEELKPLNAGEVAELNRIANMDVSKNAPPPKGEKLIYDAIDALNKTDKKFNDSEDWNDFSKLVKEKLIGKTVVVTKPVKNNDGVYDFVPEMKDGKPVVRPLTAEDIDKIGEACLYNIVNI